MDWTVGTFGTVGNDALDAGDCLRTCWTLGSAAGEVIRERLRVADRRSCEVLNPCVGAGETPAPQSGDGARDGTEDGGARVFHTGNYWLF